MPRTVRMCPRKNKSQALKVDKECRKRRTYDIFAFQYGKKILKSLGIQKISPDEITLTPKLLGK